MMFQIEIIIQMLEREISLGLVILTMSSSKQANLTAKDLTDNLVTRLYAELNDGLRSDGVRHCVVLPIGITGREPYVDEIQVSYRKKGFQTWINPEYDYISCGSVEYLPTGHNQLCVSLK